MLLRKDLDQIEAAWKRELAWARQGGSWEPAAESVAADALTRAAGCLHDGTGGGVFDAASLLRRALGLVRTEALEAELAQTLALQAVVCRLVLYEHPLHARRLLRRACRLLATRPRQRPLLRVLARFRAALEHVNAARLAPFLFEDPASPLAQARRDLDLIAREARPWPILVAAAHFLEGRFDRLRDLLNGDTSTHRQPDSAPDEGLNWMSLLLSWPPTSPHQISRRVEFVPEVAFPDSLGRIPGDSEKMLIDLYRANFYKINLQVRIGSDFDKFDKWLKKLFLNQPGISSDWWRPLGQTPDPSVWGSVRKWFESSLADPDGLVESARDVASSPPSNIALSSRYELLLNFNKLSTEWLLEILAQTESAGTGGPSADAPELSTMTTNRRLESTAPPSLAGDGPASPLSLTGTRPPAISSSVIHRTYPTPLIHALCVFQGSNRHGQARLSAGREDESDDTMNGRIRPFIESIVRFLLAIALADLLETRDRPPLPDPLPAEAEKVFRVVRGEGIPESVGRGSTETSLSFLLRGTAASTGHWVGALGEVASALNAVAESRPPLIPELAATFGTLGLGKAALDQLVEAGNDANHPRSDRPRPAASRLTGLAAMLFAELSFLRYYPLGLLIPSTAGAKAGHVEVEAWCHMGICPDTYGMVGDLAPRDAEEPGPFAFLLLGDDGRVLPLGPLLVAARSDMHGVPPTLLAFEGNEERAGEASLAHLLPRTGAGGPVRMTVSRKSGLVLIVEAAHRAAARGATARAPMLVSPEVVNYLRRPFAPDLDELKRAMRQEELELEELIGEGGSALVFAARGAKRGPNKRLAVKLLIDRDEGQHERLSYEFELLQGLRFRRHRGVINGWKAGKARAPRRFWHYFTMTRVRNGTLADVIHEPAEEAGSHYLRRVLDLYLKAVRAVAELHETGVLHRDLKPSNFLIDRNDRLIVCDFGHALRCNTSRPWPNDPFPYGTYLYLPPERFFPVVHLKAGQKARHTPLERDDGRHLRAETFDVYSLGIVLLEALIRETPVVSLIDPRSKAHHAGRVGHAFEGSTVLDSPTVKAVRQRKLPFLHIVRKCTSFDPRDRYQSAGDLARAIEAEMGRVDEFSSKWNPGSGLLR